MDWFIFSIFATLMFGVQSFLYKSSVERGCNKFFITLVFMITVEVLAVVTFLFGGITITNLLITLLLGFLFAIFFFLKTIWQLKALEYLPTNKVFPITSSDVILTVIYAIIFFKESLGTYQIIGVLAILLAINLIHYQSKKSIHYHEKKIGFLFSFLAILPGAAMVITNKYAALNTSLSFFIIIAYLFSTLLSYSSYKITSNKNRKKRNKNESIKIGILIGVVNFVGYFSLLTAMKTGPLSLIAAIHATFVIVTVLLATRIHKEQLTLTQFGLVALSVIGVILLRI